MSRKRVDLTRTVLTSAVLLAALAPGALAAPELRLLPGQLEGHVRSHLVRKGERVSALAVRHSVHPVRIYKPNRERLRDGLQYGETIQIDERRIRPGFTQALDGIVLNVPEAEVYLVDAGRLVKSYPVGVSMSDWKVPIRDSRVTDKKKHPVWRVPKSIQKEMAEKGLEVKTEVAAGPNNPLGTRWIGFGDGSLGFHGTLAPASIKRYASHGCVRFLRPDIEDLYNRVKVGQAVHVVYQPVLLAATPKAIWLSVYPDHYELGYDFKGAVTALAARAKVSDRIDWALVGRAIEDADGIVVDVAKDQPKPGATAPAGKATPKPIVKPTSKPTPTPIPELEFIAPDPEPTGSEVPLVQPSAEVTPF